MISARQRPWFIDRVHQRLGCPCGCRGSGVGFGQMPADPYAGIQQQIVSSGSFFIDPQSQFNLKDDLRGK